MEAVIGQPFTFEVLFVDAVNQPIAVTSPTITVFYFSPLGVKTTLVNQQPLVAVSPPEVGRYTYTYTFATTFTDGTGVYADMVGVEVGTGLLCRVEQQVVLIASTRAGSACGGITARFVKGG